MEVLTSRTAALVSRNPGTKRRSIRMALKASVSLSGTDRAKCSFTMLAGATDLNRHGGAIQLKRELLVGSTVGVRVKRGTQVSARVVKEVNTLDGLRTYGIEFLENDDRAKTFWGITFPPRD
jgi:hypothetical protein